MGENASSGGAGGRLGMSGGGGQIRRTILGSNLRPADQIFFPNPDKREVKKRREAYRASLERGATPTYEESMSVDHLMATVRRRIPGPGGVGYELEIRRGSEPLAKALKPKAGAGTARRTIRRVIAAPNELRGAKTLRDRKWLYSIKT